MEAKLLAEGPQRTWALVFDKGDAVIEGLTRFAREHALTAAHFTAIGAFEDVSLYYFDRQEKEYQEIPIDEQVEALVLAGNVADDGGDPKVHAHAVVGLPDGTTRGGHLNEAHVWPTLELVLTESPEHLRRTHDAETGLALIDPRS